MTNIILALTNIFTIGLTYFFSRCYYNFTRGMVMYVSFPFSETENPKLKDLLAKERKRLFITSIVFAILSLFIMIDWDYSILVFYLLMLGYFFALGINFEVSRLKIKKFKKDNNIITSPVKKVDLKATREIESSMPDKKLLLLPILIYLPALFLVKDFTNQNMVLFLAVSFVNILCILVFSYYFYRASNKIVSESSENNSLYNRRRKADLINDTISLSSLFSIISLIFTYFVSINYYYVHVYLIASCFILMIIVIVIYLKVVKANQDTSLITLNNYSEEFEDKIDIFGYKDPDNPKVFVIDPINQAKYMINRGNKKGKIIFYFLNILFTLVITLPIFLLLPANYQVEIGERVDISSGILYKDKLSKDEIEDIKLLDKLDLGKGLRTNGTSSNTQSYGNFEFEKTGPVRLYIYTKQEKVIEIKVKDKKDIYINQKTLEETNKLYENLKAFKDI